MLKRKMLEALFIQCTPPNITLKNIHDKFKNKKMWKFSTQGFSPLAVNLKYTRLI